VAVTEKPFKKCSVLVVEDETRLREMLLKAIPDMGFPVKGTRTAEDALRIMEQEPHEIIVLDLNLPCMDGLEFCEVVHQRWPQTRVIILTGFGDLPAAQKAIRLQVVDFLTKPASLGDIEASLERARRNRQEQATAELDTGITIDPEPDDEEPDTEGRATLEDVEREHILAALDRNKGNRAATAAELGISVRTLYYRLAEFQRQGYLP
jgi:two-component system response regulator RegA